jgi:hypothetical protein
MDFARKVELNVHLDSHHVHPHALSPGRAGAMVKSPQGWETESELDQFHP